MTKVLHWYTGSQPADYSRVLSDKQRRRILRRLGDEERRCFELLERDRCARHAHVLAVLLELEVPRARLVCKRLQRAGILEESTSGAYRLRALREERMPPLDEKLEAKKAAQVSADQARRARAGRNGNRVMRQNKE